MSSNSLRSVQVLTYDGQCARLALAPPRTASLNSASDTWKTVGSFQAAATKPAAPAG